MVEIKIVLYRKKVEWIGHFYCIGGILCFIKYHIRSTVWTILSCFILAGGMFVRWGRKDCSGNNTELIYSGKHLDCICLLRGAEKAHRCIAKYLKQRIGANNNLHTIASGEHIFRNCAAALSLHTTCCWVFTTSHDAPQHCNTTRSHADAILLSTSSR